MVAEGLPLPWRERGGHQDIIAGADFLSILMDSPAVRQAYRDLTTTSRPSTTRRSLQLYSNDINNEFIESKTPIIREQRSSRSTVAAVPFTFTQLPSEFGAKITPVVNYRTKVENTKQFSENLKVSVLVSSSEGKTRINKIPYDSRSSSPTLEMTTLSDQIALSSEEHPSLISQARKSEFTVDEREPINSSGGSFDDYTPDYPANVRPIPQISGLKDSQQPFEHHSIVYHDNPREPIRGRSVSYSTVIQTLPKQPLSKSWINTNHEHNERHERHYEVKNGANENKFKEVEEKHNNKEYTLTSSIRNVNDYFVTSKYAPSSDYQDDKDSKDKMENVYTSSESSQWKSPEPTEKNWEVSEKNDAQQEKPYSSNSQGHVPIIYGKPELNYEVDEAVSVMTNGRTHGVQPIKQVSTPSVEMKTGQSNDSQKVGYVVEGRNYRKYRVEERTSDGFIVGEYGVVSHDNGALRGVRYTADGTVNPRLIYDALMKFLSL